jgi:hypothetical protein
MQQEQALLLLNLILTEQIYHAFAILKIRVLFLLQDDYERKMEILLYGVKLIPVLLLEEVILLVALLTLILEIERILLFIILIKMSQIIMLNLILFDIDL